MLKGGSMKLVAALLPLALLVMPGTATAQGTAEQLYFVFKLATTLPLTVRDTPECDAQQASWKNALTGQPVASSLSFQRTYSFVSSESPATLRRALAGFAQEYAFFPTDLQGVSQATERPNAGATQTFTAPAAAGFNYAVSVYERPATGGSQSVVCVTVLGPHMPGE
ncbi:hypothetical protein Dgeo_2657 (plasmid) [Deinococcus geothermalis DSM 11300]|uniref:Secreted protein n=1 Tax=Deinococcus geothermalis (strain DSM 11300 / CIP 105573 / AG-3a) TaxID=319795 RepID=Q1J344_DEIGD|nr:hypothetical protein Dgeo_2657 [Deinococcus geothermalis DSM 11300]